MGTTGVVIGSGRWVRFGLLVLAAVPVAAGATRLVELASRPPVVPLNPRIAASPAPAIIHITSGALYLLPGILDVVEHVIARRRFAPSRLASTMVGS